MKDISMKTWLVIDPLLSGNEAGHSQTMARGLVAAGAADEIWGGVEVDQPRIHRVFTHPWPRSPGGGNDGFVGRLLFRWKWAVVIVLSQVRFFASLWPKRKDPRNWIFLNGRNFYILAMVLLAACRRRHQHAVWFFEPANRFYKLAGAFMRVLRVRNMRYFTETPSMAKEYGDLLGFACDYAAFPALVRPLASLSDKPVVLSILGPPRKEKGFDLLPDVIEALAVEREAGLLAFVVQCAPRWEPDMVDGVVDRLRGLAGVRLIHEQLTTEEYNRVLDESHAVWVPYRTAHYARRSSWVAIEGMVAGKVVLMTSGIPACEVVEARGVGLFFPDGQVPEMVASIRRLLSGRLLMQEAQDKARAFRDNGFWTPPQH